MSECIECGEEYSNKRADLGYNTCLECGSKEALTEAKRKATNIAPIYNKGPYMYIGGTDPKDLGKK